MLEYIGPKNEEGKTANLGSLDTKEFKIKMRLDGTLVIEYLAKNHIPSHSTNFTNLMHKSKLFG